MRGLFGDHHHQHLAGGMEGAGGLKVHRPVLGGWCVRGLMEDRRFAFIIII